MLNSPPYLCTSPSLPPSPLLSHLPEVIQRVAHYVRRYTLLCPRIRLRLRHCHCQLQEMHAVSVAEA